MKVNLTEMYVDDEIKNAAVAVLESRRYVKGEQAKQFEKEFASFSGAKYGIATNSGTSALHVAMLSVGIGKGDEVIVPSHTFIATASPLIHIGAKPVFAEINEKTYTIDPDDIRKKITEKTKAIIPVHLYGQPASMDEIKEIADEHNLTIIEDACQAHGAEYNGKRTGSMGDIAAFSFFPSKNLTVAGDGGMIVTNNEEYAIKAAALRDQGRLAGKKYEHDYVGFNYRMSEILAAVGRIQLKHLPQWIEERRRVAKLYNELLEDADIILPFEDEHAKHVYHLYVIRHEKRDELKDYLKEKGIASGIHYPVPVHMQPAIKNNVKENYTLPVTEKVAREVLSIPIYPGMEEEKTEYVAEEIKNFLKG